MGRFGQFFKGWVVSALSRFGQSIYADQPSPRPGNFDYILEEICQNSEKKETKEDPAINLSRCEEKENKNIMEVPCRKLVTTPVTLPVLTG